MAEAKTEKTVEKNDMVEVYIPALSSEDQYQTVIINGKMWHVLKDQFVKVPRNVGNVIKDSLEAKNAAKNFAMREIKKASNKAE
jgi:hypothetical protein